MESQQVRVNWSAPNFVNVCIDEQNEGELAGRFFHCYDKEPIKFAHFLEMFSRMEELFETIRYPQAKVYDRSFTGERETLSAKEKLQPVWQSRAFGTERGRCATFYVVVKGRDHASWQGDIVWVEQEVSKSFRSARELLILMDQALSERG